jgi:hypothetical protein
MRAWFDRFWDVALEAFRAEVETEVSKGETSR